MAEHQQQSVEDSNKCSICLEICQELKTLNCQHGFCLPCLQNWIMENDELECPNCHLLHLFPEGELQALPSNTIAVETSENIDESHGTIECCCGKCNADFYCKDCSQYLCTSCKITHELFPALKNHTLQSINATLLSTEALLQPMCPQHEKELEFYCKICKTPICQKCANTEHSEDDKQHEPIRASDAINDLKVKANALMVQADVHKQQAQVEIQKCIKTTSELDKISNNILKDINNTVEEIMKFVQETVTTLEEKLKDVCTAKKEKINSQIDELKSTISDVEEKQDSIANLLKSGEVTSLQTCEQEIIDLQEKIDDVFPETEPRGEGKIYFSSTKDSILSFLSKYGIGSVSEKPIFEIISENRVKVTCCQTFRIEIAQSINCEVDIKDLTLTGTKETNAYTMQPVRLGMPTAYIYQATENLPRNKTYLTPRIIRDKEKYFVEGSSEKDLTIDVKFRNSSIKGSPIQITVEKSKLVRNVGLWIMDYRTISDLVMSENGWFVAVCDTHEIFMFEKSGACISTVTLSNTSKVNKVCKLKNNNLIFCDQGIRNITIVQQNGEIVKSISTGLTSESLLTGIDVNEDLNLVYVADQNLNCVQVYNMESNLKIKTIGCSMGGLGGQMKRPSDIAVTKEGNLIVADTHNHRVQLFGSDGQFIKVLIGGGDKDGMVIKPSRVGVDYDENIIVGSEGKVQLFDNCGKFIRVIHQNERKHFAFSIISQYPRRLALSELNSKEISVINY
ncbi:E3 ubiquitin-protein ligase TRIM71-like [Anneissia japonica]|uniref:E3 ubiquitin-protein ligase TRIM71-like n=1 Tax=Anneissia japonica TaxID=1529436 RepID=UPI0014259766|nr:E3 ubiquitin-protein ligase TRIM71-like [Anneissia japonica]